MLPRRYGWLLAAAATLMACEEVILQVPDAGHIADAEVGVDASALVDAGASTDGGEPVVSDAGAPPPPGPCAERDDDAVRYAAWWSVVLADGAEGPVRPSASRVDRAALDICRLRPMTARIDYLGEQSNGFYEPWAHSALLIELVPGAAVDDLAELNRAWGLASVDVPHADLPNHKRLHFSQALNMRALARIYAASAAVHAAEVDPARTLDFRPPSLYGFEALTEEIWRWTVRVTGSESFSYCCWRAWTYDVDHASESLRFVSDDREGTCAACDVSDR